jgi:VWFA-related protein
MRAASLALAAAVVVAGTPAPRTPAPRQAPFQTTVDIVAVDLTVLDRDGRPVEGLRPDEVTVRVDGTPRTIASLTFWRYGPRIAPTPTGAAPPPAPPSAAAASSPTPPTRRFVVVVDRESIPAGTGQQMMRATREFIERLEPTDRVALWTVPETSSVLSFNRERADIARSLGTLAGTLRAMVSDFTIAPGEITAIEEGDRRILGEVVARECERAAGRVFGERCPAEIERIAKQEATDARSRAEVTLRSLRALVEALGQFDGVKHVVLVSGVIPQLRDVVAWWRDLGAAAAASRVLVHSLPTQQRTNDVLDTERPGLAANPAWTALTNAPSAAASLAVMTGGFNSAAEVPAAAFARLDRELSGVYLLAFEASPADRDGKPHRIEVSVAGRRGSSVRARQQFVLAPAPALASTAPAASLEVAATSAPPARAAERAAPAEEASFAPVTLETLAGRVGDYVSRFLEEHKSVVIEEQYVQIAKPWRGMPKSPDAEPALAWDRSLAKTTRNPIIATRRLRSDVLVVQASNQVPIAYRDVYEVDDRPVRDRAERVRDLFLSKDPGAKQQLLNIAAESARYNLGSVRRTVNTPTFPLLYLRPGFFPRLKLSTKGRETVGGRPCVIVEFKETQRPALVGTPDGGDVMAWGRFWVEPATGRVRQVEVRLETQGGQRRLLQVRFADTERIDVLVPERMWEWYEGASLEGRDGLWNTGAGQAYIECLATYSNLRRFTVETTEQVR